MDRIWSPWRSRHIARTSRESSSRETASVFRKIAEEDRDEENYVVWRGDLVFIAMNLYPYNKGHLLILPYRQVTCYTDLTSEEQKALMQATERAMDGLDEVLAPDGFHTGMNLGKSAGAGIPEHLHVHVVPRWIGDPHHMASEDDRLDLESDMQQTYHRLREVV